MEQEGVCMSYQWILTPIPVPEIGAVIFKPGTHMHTFNGRMLLMTLPQELPLLLKWLE